MSDIKWIKIVTDIFDDEKMLLIETLPEADSIIVIWFKLLCLAGKQNNSGVFTLNGKIPYTDKMLATIFRRKETTVKLALETFENFGMIEIINNTITIPNWSKHQDFSKIERNKEYMREYMKQYRERQKLLAEGKEQCKVNSKVNSKANVSSLDKIRQDKNRIDKNNKKAPTLEEIQNYITEKNLKVDGKQFYDYFTEGNWIDSKGNKVKNWKQKLLTWDRYGTNIQKEKQTNYNNYDKRNYDDLEKFYKNKEV